MPPRIFVALDLETTGLEPGTDRITEVGLVRFTLDDVQERYSALVNPQRPIPYRIEQLTQIRNADVRDAPLFDAVRSDVEQFIGTAVIVGQNVAFDLKFLAVEGIAPPGPVLDTWELATLVDPGGGVFHLRALAERYGVAMPTQHRALADADTARLVFLTLYRRVRALPPELWRELQRFAEGSDWALPVLLTSFAEELAAPAGSLPSAAGRRRPVPPAVSEPEIAEPPALEPGSIDPDEAERVLAAGLDHPEAFGAFEQRSEQVGMTRAVVEALAEAHHLIVEAGTGTGKSLAYLIPAALHALRNGERVIVSTNTIALQEQLLHKDVPALRLLLRDTLGSAADALQVEPLKGRRNYLCRRRVAHERHGGPGDVAAARLLGRILVWLQSTSCGDRAEIVVPRTEEAAWTRLSAEGADCLSDRECRYVRDGSCFLLRARRRADAASILIVNHALLLSDLAAEGAVLPAADVLIIDEAHHLEDTATEHLGASLTSGGFLDLLDALQRSATRGAGVGLAAVLRKAGNTLPRGSERDRLVAAGVELPPIVERARAAVDELFDALAAFVEEQTPHPFGYERRLRIRRTERAQPGWSGIEVLQDRVAEELTALEAHLATVDAALAVLTEGALPDYDGLVAEVASLRDGLAARREQAGTLLTHYDADVIAWLSSAPRSGAVAIRAAPLRVGDLLAERLYAGKRSVVLTGATLTAAGRFDYLRDSVGLADADEVQFGSPFNYQQHALLLLPTDMPDPSDRDYQRALQETLVDLVRANEGRALVLFTSHAALRATAEGVRAPLEEAEIVTLVQGPDGPPARLLAALVEHPRSVVFGTASLWEGVDIPGASLSLVVIARLPFAVPTDPVVAARSELYDDPFRRHALPQAVVRFRQGFGRLIRRRDDRGVVAVLDGRITSKNYGNVFVESLPPVRVRLLPRRDFAPAVREWPAS